MILDELFRIGKRLAIRPGERVRDDVPNRLSSTFGSTLAPSPAAPLYRASLRTDANPQAVTPPASQTGGAALLAPNDGTFRIQGR
jgi:hypothetical protein